MTRGEKNCNKSIKKTSTEGSEENIKKKTAKVSIFGTDPRQDAAENSEGKSESQAASAKRE